MRFEDILNRGRLWAVVYEEDDQNILSKIMGNWMDPVFLGQFFEDNINDLKEYFNIINIDQAIYDTVVDAARLSCLILDINPNADLNSLFRPLENSRMREMLLSREKAKGGRLSGHASWLRIYAIKLDEQVFLVTGGAIKLTPQMVDRQHTLKELQRMERVRNYLLDNGVIDKDGFNEFLSQSWIQ